VNNFNDPTTGAPANGAAVRGNAVAGAEYRYPFLATTGSIAHVVEPIGQIIARPNSIGNQQLIPNEDANSLVFDDTLLFDIDKFSGYDRIETGTRANVGVRYTAQFYSGAYARAVFGESYQLAGENEFALSAPASGLDTSRSDYVSGLYLQATNNLSFSGQTRFDHTTWDVRRTDLNSTAKYGPVELGVNYADVKDAPGLGQNAPQEEILTRGTLTLTENWALLGNIRYDLETDRRVADGIGLRYQDDCFTLGVTYVETNIKDLDIQPDKTFLVNFTLKDLGSYQFKSDAFGLAGDLPN
jgi:LPS-assembly protein